MEDIFNVRDYARIRRQRVGETLLFVNAPTQPILH